ncbi:MAG: purine-binding chemotaxis protein CheW [Candidatus Omnitrophica bacterium]|nr:purine-binding chemotaxis protein CheW [Candidatus Omnitrophota bacterium]
MADNCAENNAEDGDLKKDIEIVEFSIGGCFYGINVADIREIIRVVDDFISVPDTHTSIEGVINLRGNIIPVVHLARHLKMDIDYNSDESRVIVCEYGERIAGFWVGAVNRIHRMSLSQVERPSDLVNAQEGYATGLVKIDDKVVFLLDFQRVADDIIHSYRRS